MGSLEKRFPIYSRWLKLYPIAYQRYYRQQMLQTLADMLDDPEKSKSATWLRTTIDLPFSLIRENAVSVGDIMRNETPHYVKRNLVVETVLLVPFFSLIAINSLSNHALDFTNSWKRLFFWLLIGLPLVASILGVVTFVRWNHQRKRGFWQSLLDVRHNWLILGLTGLAFLIVIFVPFHDSAQCVAGNPVGELKHLHETWRCIQNPPQGPR